MNKKVQRSWSDVRTELNARLDQFAGGYNELATEAGISYHAARRFLLNKAKNRTETAEKLCRFFRVDLDKTANLQNEILSSTDSLTQLIEEVWDGTEAHARLLAQLIGITRDFSVQNRSETRQSK